MKIRVAFLLVLLLGILTLRTAVAYLIEYEIQVEYELKNEGANPYLLTIDDKTIIYSMNSSWQVLYLVEGNIIRRKFDADNNSIAILDWPSVLAPRESIAAYLVYHVYLWPKRLPTIYLEKSESLEAIPPDLKKYCESTGSWRYNEWPELVELAKKIAGTERNVLRIVYRFIDWIGEHIAYKVGVGPRYPNETYKEGSGDCDDQANLLITLCRIVGIPAYLQTGCIYFPKMQPRKSYLDDIVVILEENIGFHGWAVVYIPPWGWLPVDLTYGYDKENPETAITGAAIVSLGTVSLSNVIFTDHVRDFRKCLSQWRKYNLHLKVRYSMSLLLIEDRYSPLILTSGTLALVCITVTTVTSYFIVRRKARRERTG